MPEIKTAEAIVDRVRHANPNTGWAVLAMMTADRTPFVAVGSLADAEPGSTLEVTGSWKKSSYGLQFEVTESRRLRPACALGIVRYLSGIQGVGPETARRLFDHFGEATLEKLATGPEAAAEVPGIGPTRAPKIYQAVTERTRRDNVLIELQSLGIGAALAGRVLRWAGEEDALARVQADPYALRRLKNVGFQTADQVAARLGLQHDDPRRIDAGIVYALDDAAQDGHCCLPRDELVTRAAKALKVSGEKIEPQIDRLLRDEIFESGDGIYHGRLWRAEERLSTQLERLVRDASESLAYVPDPSGIVLSEEQLAAVELALRSKVFILTGGPGTGKTTITRAIVRSLEAAELELELASPTGRAAARLADATGKPAATIHRLLEYHPECGFRRDRYNPLECKVLIVDEVSMLDVFLAGDLLDAVEDSCRVIFVGDADQLPSVGPGRVLCDLIDSGRIPTARLTKIFRQAAESHIVTSAHRVNRGELPEAGTNPERNDLFIALSKDAEEAADILIETVVERIPSVMGLDPHQIQVLTPMKKGVLGTGELNKRLRALLNPTGEKILKGKFRVGDRVMQVKNNYDLWVMNGEIGSIVFHDSESREVGVQICDELKRYAYKDLTHLELAYACTIHKSQGSEYPCVVIALHRYHHVLLQRDLLYTAITRAKRLCVIIGDPSSIRKAVRTVGGNSRYTGLTRRLIHAAAERAVSAKR